MKNLKRNILAGAILAVSCTATVAQNTYSGYFLDGYNYRFQMNPAFGNDRGFVSFPVLGDLNLNLHGNLNLSDVLYDVNGKTVLFTNPNVSTAEAMKGFGDKNKIGANVNLDLISVGFKAFGGYNTVSISANVNANASLPGSFFELAKEGVTNKTYDIKNMYANAHAYATIALNHSRDIKQVPGLRVGGTLKFHIGGGNVDFKFNRAELTLGQDSWTAITDADIYASLTGFRYDHKYNDDTHREYVSGGNLDDGYGLNGFGMGIDLGAEYKWRDFSFSAAVLDLGFMSWGKTAWASTNGEQRVDTDAFTFNANGDAPNSFDNEWERLRNDISNLYQLEDNGTLSSRSRALAATVNLGVGYEFPYYRKLHFGLVNSTYINGNYSWTQFRVSANVAPVKFFSADANFVAGTYGVGFGWLVNLHTRGINFFVGMDHTFGKLSKQFIPLKSNADFNMGINFPF
ncbi:MAG: DUF5723 family protein [Clostridium sp.]|nr:DUF5723 family protein [Clostridium sp.]MCM1476029.1 DUF5723 family protein [Muribaculaceae bacterium]